MALSSYVHLLLAVRPDSLQLSTWTHTRTVREPLPPSVFASLWGNNALKVLAQGVKETRPIEHYSSACGRAQYMVVVTTAQQPTEVTLCVLCH